LLENSRGIGTALLMSENRDIFYLVTKWKSRYEKPTYKSIETAIQDMFDQAIKKDITKIAMPKIGCGLDGKKWETVRNLIVKHQPETIDVVVCYL
jgi:O-acetyl-ADP-ribose deacetylase (regulator of RNase III)